MKIIRKLFKIAFVIIVLFMAFYFIGYLSYNDPGKVLNTVEQDSSLNYLEIDGYRFHADTFGNIEDTMVLVLHGGPGGDYRYLLNLKELNDRYFVVFYDQRGTGLSQRTEGAALGYDTAIADVKSIIEYYKPNEKAIIVGHSWGAMLGSGFLGKYPEMVHKAVLIEPGFLNSEMADGFFEATNGMRPDFSFTALKHLIKSYFESVHVKEPDANASKDYFMQQLMMGTYPGHPMRGYYCNEDVSSVEVPIWRTGALASQYMMASGFDDEGNLVVDFASGLDTIDVPVLMIASECNTIAGASVQKKYLHLFENVKFKTIEDAGHYMVLEKPKETVKVIQEFIEE